MGMCRLYSRFFFPLHKCNKTRVHICKLYGYILITFQCSVCIWNTASYQFSLLGLKKHCLACFLQLKHMLGWHELLICIKYSDCDCKKDMWHRDLYQNKHRHMCNQLLDTSPYPLLNQLLFKNLISWIWPNQLKSKFKLIPLDKFQNFNMN